jgi:hypothetical protein
MKKVYKIGQDGHRIPTKQQCRCAVCQLMFGGEQAFEAHRVGPYGRKESPRRCLKPDEFAEAGLKYDFDRDEWQTEARFQAWHSTNEARLGVG